MGKPIAEARAEVDKCAWTCAFYAEPAAALLAPEPVETGADDSFATYEPLGVVLAIMLWNFPFWQVTRFAAPALMAGNGGLLKHAPNVSGCALAFEAYWRTSASRTGCSAPCSSTRAPSARPPRACWPIPGSPRSRSPAATGPGRTSPPRPGGR